MKIINRIVLFLVISFVTISVEAQISNADSMVHKLFTTLKNNDEKAFVSLYPNGKQMATMMRSMMEQMFKSEEMQKMMTMDEKSRNLNVDSLINAQLNQFEKPEAQAEMQKSFARNFQDVIEKGEKKGVNWSQAQLVSYTVDSSATSEDDEEMKMFAGAGIKNIKGIIDFRSGGNDYQMNFDKVLFIPAENGWFGGEFKQVIKKGESFTQESDKDAENTADDEANAEVKTKTKIEGNKTKTKTKTPAGKAKTKVKTKN